MNEEKYNKIVGELENLAKEAAASVNIRIKLVENLPQGTTKEDAIAVLVAFYEYINKVEKKDSGFEILSDYCRNTVSSYYSETSIKNNVEKIVKDAFLLEKLLNVCNDSVTKNLLKSVSALNDIYTKTGDNSYLDVYNKIKEKYETTVDKTKNNIEVSERLSENAKIEAEKKKHVVEMLNNESSNLQNKGVNITSEELYRTIEKNNIDVKENAGIRYSSSMERAFEAKERLLSLPFPNFVKLVEKTSGYVMKKANYDVITLDSKKTIFVSGNKKTNALTSVDERIADIGGDIALKIATAKDGWHKVVNKAYCKKVEMTQMVVDTKGKAKETIKEIMGFIKNKTKKFVNDVKDKKDEVIEKTNEKIQEFDNSIRYNVSNSFERAAKKLSEIAIKVSQNTTNSQGDVTVSHLNEIDKQYQSYSMDELKAVLQVMMQQGIKGQNANLIASGAVLPRYASQNGMSM